MQFAAMQSLTIESFLPLSKLAAIRDGARTSYASAKPFPHVVVDDFLDPDLLRAVLGEFPKPRQIEWQAFDNPREIKLASAAESSFGPITSLLLYHLNSITFLDFLSDITGIPDLIPDPCFDGGGLHQIMPGGK